MRYVKNLTLCTVLGDDSGVTVGTVEHLLAALRGLSIDNCYVETTPATVPSHGRQRRGVRRGDRRGRRSRAVAAVLIKVLQPVRVQDGDCWWRTPHSGYHLDVEIDFPTPLIGQQRLALEMNAGAFRNEICRARTFGFMRDVENLWKAGLALGASLNNTIALADDRIMNAEGLRYPQEFVRHKMLDAMGDLALAGGPMLGAYRSVRGGHRLNARVVEALLADKEAWSTVRAPWVREVAPVDVSVGVAAVNYAADRT